MTPALSCLTGASLHLQETPDALLLSLLHRPAISGRISCARAQSAKGYAACALTGKTWRATVSGALDIAAGIPEIGGGVIESQLPLWTDLTGGHRCYTGSVVPCTHLSASAGTAGCSAHFTVLSLRPRRGSRATAPLESREGEFSLPSQRPTRDT